MVRMCSTYTTFSSRKRFDAAQILIMRVKRLIDFFMRPKQSERLEEIQKQFPDIGNDNDKKNNDDKDVNN